MVFVPEEREDVNFASGSEANKSAPACVNTGGVVQVYEGDSNVVSIDGITERIKANFWAKVNKTDGCWLWLGATGASRCGRNKLLYYGNFRVGNRMVTAHRASWMIHFGVIPAGIFVCHHCDVPLCVRPDHLFLGTPKDNIQDAVSKGRMQTGPRSEEYLVNLRAAMIRREAAGHNGSHTHPERVCRGEAKPHAVLTNEKVREIRRIYATGQLGYIRIGKRFGISGSHVRDVVKKKTWAHVE